MIDEPHRPARTPLPCSDTSGCHLPYAWLEGDVLVILSRHNTEQHRNMISLSRLLALAGWQGGPIAEQSLDKRTGPSVR